MGTYNASAYNDNHTLLKLILNIQDYLHKNPNVALYHTVGFQGTVATTSIPKDKVYGPAGSTNTPTAGDLILYALDLGQGFFQVGGADEFDYTGEYIGQTLTGPKGDPGPEGPEGPEGPAGTPGVKLYYTTGFRGTVATTSIPKDKVHGPTGSTTTPIIGDVILYALDLGQGYFMVSGMDASNYIGSYIGQTVQGDKGDPGPEGPEGPEGPAGTPGVKLYYTTGFRGTVATTSIPKDKVHGPTGSTTTPIIGDVILYALDLGQGYFMVSGMDASNYIGSYIGQTVQGDKGDPGTPGAAATIAVGTVTTGDPTTPAAVSNVGTENAAVFNFTIPRGEKGDKGDPGTGYSQLTGLYFNRQNDSVTYSDGIAVFVGQFQLTTADGNSTFANGAVTLPIVAGAGIIIEASADGRSLIIKAAPTEYVISGGYGHCENNNPAAVADEGTAYVATITANSGYNFGTGYTLTVTMGGTDITSEVAIVSTDTISINIPSVTGDIYINCVAVEIPPQLATPTIAMNADGKTLEITDVANATSYDVYVDGTLKTNVASVPNTTTFDLSTLSDITDGTHTVKVKAKANGYNDSEFSNEVSYTKAPVLPVYTVTFSSNFTVTGTGNLYGIYYINETGVRTLLPVTEDNYTTYRGQTFKASSIEDMSGNYDYAKITIDGKDYYNRSWSTPHLPLTLSAPATITKVYSDF